MDIPQTDRRPSALEGHVKAWFAVLVALYPATILGAVVLVLGVVLSNPRGWSPGTGVSLFGVLAPGAIFAIPLSLIFSVLATPFLPFRGWIVRDKAPFLRPGYAAVALYGPAILLLMQGGQPQDDFAGTLVAYEVIALTATGLYVPLARRLGLFPKPPPIADIFA